MSSAFADVLGTATDPTPGQFHVQPMSSWDGLSADLVCTDPPFGIDFDGQKSNYNRDDGRVVDGYVEWGDGEYDQRVQTLLDVASRNTHTDGQVLVFSGWQNSIRIHDGFLCHDDWTLEGKLYWCYNFAPYCTRRPAHNVYEIFWGTKTGSEDWYYDNECSHEHCADGEANLSAIDVNREYISEMPKYPTRLPPQIVRVLLEHFTADGDTVLDPLAGSGTVGLVADEMDREWYCGDSNNEAKTVFTQTREAITDGLSL